MLVNLLVSWFFPNIRNVESLIYTRLEKYEKRVMGIRLVDLEVTWFLWLLFLIYSKYSEKKFFLFAISIIYLAFYSFIFFQIYIF